MMNLSSVNSLFSNFKTDSTTSGLYGSLSELASIRSGSYRKLAEKYYGNSSVKSSDNKSSERVSNTDYDYKKGDYVKNLQSTSTSSDSTSTLAATEASADKLKDAVNVLTNKDSDSVFSQTSGKYDEDKIKSAVTSFVKNYNSLIDNASDSDSSTINNAVNSMKNTTIANSKLLNKIGISVGADNKLTLNDDVFKKADMSTVKSIFNGNGSYGYQTSVSASMIDYAARNEAAKSNTYTQLGSYSYNYNSGNIFNQYL